MKHTLQNKLDRQQENLVYTRNAIRAEQKDIASKFTLKLSKVQKKSVQKLSFDKDVWSKKGKHWWSIHILIL